MFLKWFPEFPITCRYSILFFLLLWTEFVNFSLTLREKLRIPRGCNGFDFECRFLSLSEFLKEYVTRTDFIVSTCLVGGFFIKPYFFGLSSQIDMSLDATIWFQKCALYTSLERSVCTMWKSIIRVFMKKRYTEDLLLLARSLIGLFLKTILGNRCLFD